MSLKYSGPYVCVNCFREAFSIKGAGSSASFIFGMRIPLPDALQGLTVCIDCSAFILPFSEFHGHPGTHDPTVHVGALIGNVFVIHILRIQGQGDVLVQAHSYVIALRLHLLPPAAAEPVRHPKQQPVFNV